MSIETNLHGRLRNTHLPVARALLPLFEAVSNSIHAIEDVDEQDYDGEIRIEIIRESQSSFEFSNSAKRGRSPEEAVFGFRVIDNGVGFTNENLKSFRTLDSEYKADRGARGVGRLLWLKAFDQASIESVFKDSGRLRKRKFRFDSTHGASDPQVFDVTDEDRRTSVTLEGFVNRYREASPKTAKAIAKGILEHCLWYFVRAGGAPRISVVDGSEQILLDDLFQEIMFRDSRSETIEIKGFDFAFHHVKLFATSGQSHTATLCAANRVVTQEKIKGRIPGLHGAFQEGDEEFIYQCFVSSDFLDDRVRPERTAFDINEDNSGLFSGEISKSDILDKVLERAEVFLEPYLSRVREAGRARVSDFVSKTKPRYRPVLNRIPETTLSVDPNISDKDLDLLLHGHLADIESSLLSQGHDIMRPKESETLAQYQERLQEYLDVAEDIKKSDLASYVTHRKVILDLLEELIKSQEDGKYAKEQLIHDLIMPMGSTSDDIHPDSCDLWLVDESLAFHEFLASDKKLSSMPITGSKEEKEPDLLALSVYENPVLVTDSDKLPLSSIVVVELKRPMRNDAAAGEDKDPVEQALGYLDRVRKGDAKTKNGRPIPNSEHIPGFCYAICDITSTVRRRCEFLNLTVTAERDGYFGYNRNFGAYIEVISFDRLVNKAKERNRAFFDRLGLPAV